jgi:hypothetical protein
LPLPASAAPATRDIEIVLEDEPSALSVLALLNADTAIDTALRDRPELHAVRQLTAIDEISARAARDSMLPKLDLVGRGESAARPHFCRAGPLRLTPSRQRISKT